VAEWFELAKACHRSRALGDVSSGLKVLIGGKVELTTCPATA
jgi:hypothetical protein